MHIRSIDLGISRSFRDKHLNFCDPETGLPHNLIVLVGDNGAGKSSVLQALAATIGTATRRLGLPGELSWPGFDLDLVGNAWRTPYEAIASVYFSREGDRSNEILLRSDPGFGIATIRSSSGDATTGGLKFEGREDPFGQFRGIRPVSGA